MFFKLGSSWAVLAFICSGLVGALEYYEQDGDTGRETPKIAIVGGGIGGTATAYYLSKFFDQNVILDLYESDVVGGRIASKQFAGSEYEVGGTVIHPSNAHMEEFLNVLELSKKKPDTFSSGIFNGESYDYVDSYFNFVNILKLLWRYGLDIYRLNRINTAMLSNFERIYDLQRRFVTFNTVSDLLKAMDSTFPELCSISTRDFFLREGLSERIIDELVTAVTRGNYVQMPSIHAFVGPVSVAAADPNLWSVKGGNKQIPEGLLSLSKATLIRRRVTKISPRSEGGFHVFSRSGVSVNLLTEGSGHQDSVGDSSEVSNHYDAVVIAAPLTPDKSPLKLVNFSKSFEFDGVYQRLVCTLVSGRPNPRTFKYDQLGYVVEDVFTDNVDLFFGMRQKIVNVYDEEIPENDETIGVYKVVSKTVLTKDELDVLFEKYYRVETVNWLGSPLYKSNEVLETFELLPGMYYNNAAEKAVSNMEMAAIAAKNNAMLVYKFLEGPVTGGRARDEL